MQTRWKSWASASGSPALMRPSWGNAAYGRTLTDYAVTVTKAGASTGFDYEARWTEPPAPSIIAPPPTSSGYTRPPAPYTCVQHLFSLVSPAVAVGVVLTGQWQPDSNSGCQHWQVIGETVGGRIGP